MSLTSALSVALSGLQVSTAQLQLTANNIANAKNPGYTAKTANLANVILGTDAGGVTIAGFTRAVNDGLSNSLNASTAESSFYGTQNNYMRQVQALLNSTADNPALSDAVAKFQSAWTQFSAAPESTAQQQAVIQAGTNLAAQVRNAASAIQRLNQQVVKDTNGTISTLNDYLQQLATLNNQISSASGNADSSVVNLLDERDKLVTEISKITKVTAVPRSNDQIALYTPTGLLLLDGAPQVFSYNGTTVTTATGLDVTSSLTGGSLQAQLQFTYDGSPAAVSTDPGTEVIRKLNSQIVALTDAFTNVTAGTPTRFALAYNSATTGSGELASSFFSVTTSGGIPDPNTFVVNANLLDGTSTIKQAAGATVVASLSAARSFTADGLSIPSGTYADLSTGILAHFQQAANTINGQSETAQQQQTYYQQSLSNATGVNVDNELVNLTTLQNSYAASARVIGVINQMMEELTSLVG